MLPLLERGVARQREPGAVRQRGPGLEYGSSVSDTPTDQGSFFWSQSQ